MYLQKFIFTALIGLSLSSYCFTNEIQVVESCCSDLEKSNTNELIYIQQAKVAELTTNPNKIGAYLLKVGGSDKTLVYFSDKPERDAGTLSLSQFVKSWQNMPQLKENPPNAVISFVKFKASSESGVGADILQLSNPVYDFSTDTVTFEAAPLHEFEVTTGRFENVVMVFDGIATNYEM